MIKTFIIAILVLSTFAQSAKLIRKSNATRMLPLTILSQTKSNDDEVSLDKTEMIDNAQMDANEKLGFAQSEDSSEWIPVDNDALNAQTMLTAHQNLDMPMDETLAESENSGPLDNKKWAADNGVSMDDFSMDDFKMPKIPDISGKLDHMATTAKKALKDKTDKLKANLKEGQESTKKATTDAIIEVEKSLQKPYENAKTAIDTFLDDADKGIQKVIDTAKNTLHKGFSKNVTVKLAQGAFGDLPVDMTEMIDNAQMDTHLKMGFAQTEGSSKWIPVDNAALTAQTMLTAHENLGIPMDDTLAQTEGGANGVDFDKTEMIDNAQMGAHERLGFAQLENSFN